MNSENSERAEIHGLETRIHFTVERANLNRLLPNSTEISIFPSNRNYCQSDCIRCFDIPWY